MGGVRLPLGARREPVGGHQPLGRALRAGARRCSDRGGRSAPLSGGARRLAGGRAVPRLRVDRADLHGPKHPRPARSPDRRLLGAHVGRHGLLRPRTWLRHADPFATAFGVLARFAPTEVRVTDREACRRCGVACAARDGACLDCGACFDRAAPARREWNLRPFARRAPQHGGRVALDGRVRARSCSRR